MRLNRKLPTIRENFRTLSNHMNGKNEKSLNHFFKCFICGNRVSKRTASRLSLSIQRTSSGMHVRDAPRTHQRYSFKFQNEQHRIFDSARAGGRTFGMHDYAMPPRHRVFFPVFGPARAAASTFLHAKAAKARPPLDTLQALSLEGGSATMIPSR